MALKAAGKAVDLTNTPPPLNRASEIPILLIKSVDNPGRMDNDNKLDELRHAIESHGSIIEPLVLRPLNKEYDGDNYEDGKYATVAGRRRLRIAKALGYKTVPAVMWNPGTGKNVVSPVAVAIKENIAHKALTAPEYLKAILDYAADQDWDVKIPKPAKDGGKVEDAACGKDVAKIAAEFNTSKANVYRTMRLGLLGEEALKRVHNKGVAAETARDLAGEVALGHLTSEQADLVLDRATENAKKADAKAKEKARPDSRTPDQIKADKVEMRKKKAKKKARMVGSVGKGDASKAAKELASEGKLSQSAADAVVKATGKGGNQAAKTNVDRFKEIMDELLTGAKNKHIVFIASANIRFIDGEIMKPELLKVYEKHIQGDDE